MCSSLTPSLFPYATLFRSAAHHPAHGRAGGADSGRRGLRSRLRYGGISRGRGRISARQPPGDLPRREEAPALSRSEEHTSELQSRLHLVCRLLLEKKKLIT